MKDKVVLITGATSGIGKETAIGLAGLGATIVFTARNLDEGRLARDEITIKSKNGNVDFLHCDLASFDSIRSCCEEFKSRYELLDVLINNAGTAHQKRTESKDGIEETFAVNYLAPFLMTDLLLDTLKRSSPSRIINVVSELHQGTIDFSDIEFRERFSGMKAYSQSKLALMLFTRLLAGKLKGTGVTVNYLHPGGVSTNIGRNLNIIYRMGNRLLGKDPKEGAEASIYLASSPEVEDITGEYFVDNTVKQSSPESQNMEIAKKLWNLSVDYIHIHRYRARKIV